MQTEAEAETETETTGERERAGALYALVCLCLCSLFYVLEVGEVVCQASEAVSGVCEDGSGVELHGGEGERGVMNGHHDAVLEEHGDFELVGNLVGKRASG